MRVFRLPVAAIVYCAVSLAVGLLDADPWLRSALLLPLVLLLPGLLTVLPLFSPRSMPPLELAIYAVALSMAICALGGVAIQLVTRLDDSLVWLVFLCAYTTVGAITLIAQRTDRWAIRITLPGATVGSLVLLLVALALTAGAIVIASAGARSQRSEAHFADLWILPSKPSPAGTAVTVGVGNHEGRPAVFEVDVSRGSDHLLRTRIRLGDGQSWSDDVSVPGPPGTVRATLLQDGRPSRRVHLDEAVLR